MPKIAKPWCRKGRGWYVTLYGKQIPLGQQRKQAFERYHDLLRQPPERRTVPADLVSALADLFLDWPRAAVAGTPRWLFLNSRIVAARLKPSVFLAMR